MKIRNKYILAALSLVLSASLAVPLCCHASSLERIPTSPEQQWVGQGIHILHSQQDCHCGHQFRKGLAKANDGISKSLQQITIQFIFYEDIFTPAVNNLKEDYFTDYFLQVITSPPIHVLNSVFLN